jgi:hypothetical protein
MALGEMDSGRLRGRVGWSDSRPNRQTGIGQGSVESPLFPALLNEI